MSQPAGQPAVPLEGRLSGPEVLPRLLTALWQGQWSGALVVESGDVERRIYLAEGRIQTVESGDPAEALAARLVAAGVVDEADVQKAANHLGARDRASLTFARKLVGLGLLDEPALRAAEASRVTAVVETVLALRTGRYRSEGGAIPSGETIPQALDAPVVVATSVLTRWDASWAMNVLGGMGTVLAWVPEALGDYEATGADEAYDLTLLRVDGQRSVGDVLGASPLPEEAVVRFLAACRLLGVVEPVAVALPASAEPAAVPAPSQAPRTDESRPSPGTVPAGAPVEGSGDDDSAPGAADAGYYRPPRPPAPDRQAEEGPAVAARARRGPAWWLAWLLVIAALSVLGVAAYRGWSALSGRPAAAGDRP